MKFVDTPGLSKSNPTAQEFLAKYLQKYPQPASEWELGARYDSVCIIKNAIESCGDVNTECINNYLHNMSDYNGVIGKYHFDKNGDPVGLPAYAVKQIINAEKGEIIELAK